MQRLLCFAASLVVTAPAFAGNISLADPKGDDNGPGTYTYPTDPAYKKGSFDLTEVEIKDAGANLELETFRGSIASDFPLTLQPGQSTGGRRDRRLDFTIGNGGARISAESFSGDITIRRLPARGNEEQDE